ADTQQQSAQDRARHMTVREQQFQQGLNQNKYVTKVGKDGNLYAINKGDPSDVIGITKADGTPFESWDSAVEAGRKARFEEAQNRQDRRQRERIAAGGGKKGRGMTAQQAHVAARDELIKEGKIDADGTMENPKWRDLVNQKMQILDSNGKPIMSQQEAEERSTKYPRRIPYQEHKDFKDRVTRKQAASQTEAQGAGGGGGAGQGGGAAKAPRVFPLAEVDGYAKRKGMNRQAAIAALQAAGWTVQ